MMILFSIFIFMFSSQAALDAKYDDYDGYSLIKVLIDDNKLDLAKNELESWSGERQNSFHFYYLGVIEYKKGNYTKAVQLLAQSEFVKNSLEAMNTELFLARSYFYLDKHALCAQSFEKSSGSQLYGDNDILMQVGCYRKAKNYDEAWAVLSKKLQSTTSLEILEASLDFLLELRMYFLATNLSLEWFAGRSVNVSSDYIAIAEFFNKREHFTGRLKLLELARLQFPLDIDVNLNLNQIYFEKGMLLAVEEGFARASLVDRKYSYHAAEMNRQVGRYERSQFFNAQIPDDKERLKQKLATYVDKGQFAMIASLESILQRSPLINDDEIRYALAYSLVRSGEYKRPLQYLSKITHKDFLEKTVILRNALTDCVENNKVCNL